MGGDLRDQASPGLRYRADRGHGQASAGPPSEIASSSCPARRSASPRLIMHWAPTARTSSNRWIVERSSVMALGRPAAYTWPSGMRA